MSAMRSETKSEIGLWLGAGGQKSTMQCNCYKHPILRGSAERDWPQTSCKSLARIAGGHRRVVVSRYQGKKLGCESNHTCHTLTYSRSSTSEPTEFGPRLSHPDSVPASSQLTACERRCPSLPSPPSRNLFVQLLNPNGKRTRDMPTTTTTTRPAPEILPEMTPCRASRHLMRTRLPPLTAPCPPSPPLSLLSMLLLDPMTPHVSGQAIPQASARDETRGKVGRACAS